MLLRTSLRNIVTETTMLMTAFKLPATAVVSGDVFAMTKNVDKSGASEHGISTIKNRHHTSCKG